LLSYGCVVVSFLRRLNTVGRLPGPLRAQLEPEGIIHVAEKVRVKQRFSGAVPGRRDALGANRHTGVVVFTRQRLYALLPTVPRLRGPTFDERWDSAGGPAAATVDASGMRVQIALNCVDPRFHGDLSLQFDMDLTSVVLNALPSRSVSFAVPPEHVFQMLGVRVRT
jgi:hypothetical protein